MKKIDYADIKDTYLHMLCQAQTLPGDYMFIFDDQHWFEICWNRTDKIEYRRGGMSRNNSSHVIAYPNNSRVKLIKPSHRTWDYLCGTNPKGVVIQGSSILAYAARQMIVPYILENKGWLITHD